MDILTQCLFHAKRISALVQIWDHMRGPGQALPSEDVDRILAEVTIQNTLIHTTKFLDITSICDRIAKTERILVAVLKDPVYLNDDRDREIIVARMALCQMLRELKAAGIQSGEIETLWIKNDCEEW